MRRSDFRKMRLEELRRSLADSVSGPLRSLAKDKVVDIEKARELKGWQQLAMDVLHKER